MKKGDPRGQITPEYQQYLETLLSSDLGREFVTEKLIEAMTRLSNEKVEDNVTWLFIPIRCDLSVQNFSRNNLRFPMRDENSAVLNQRDERGFPHQIGKVASAIGPRLMIEDKVRDQVWTLQDLDVLWKQFQLAMRVVDSKGGLKGDKDA